jgi:hypothetical protein
MPIRTRERQVRKVVRKVPMREWARWKLDGASSSCGKLSITAVRSAGHVDLRYIPAPIQMTLQDTGSKKKNVHLNKKAAR